MSITQAEIESQLMAEQNAVLEDQTNDEMNRQSFLYPQVVQPKFVPKYSNSEDGQSVFSSVLTKSIPRDDPPHSRLFVRCSKVLTEEDLYQLFAPFGFVENIKLVEDKLTRENKGAVFVKYAKASEAARAKEELNGKSIANGMMYVQLAEPRHATVENSLVEQTDFPPNSRLFVTCPKNMTDEDLHKIFCGFGEIQHVSILLDRHTGESRGASFVKFAKSSSAVKATEELAHSGLVQCRLAESRSHFLRTKEAEDVYMYGGVPHEESSDMFSEMSWAAPHTGWEGEYPMTYAPLTSYNLAHAQMYTQRGYGRTPTYDSQVAGYQSKGMVPQSFRARQNRMGNNYPIGSRLFVSFSKPLDQQVLNAVFGKFGGLEKVYLLPGKHFGYAKYNSAEVAQTVIRSLNNKIVEGSVCRAVLANPQLSPDAPPKPFEPTEGIAFPEAVFPETAFLRPEAVRANDLHAVSKTGDNDNDSSGGSSGERSSGSSRARRDPYGTGWVVEEEPSA